MINEQEIIPTSSDDRPAATSLLASPSAPSCTSTGWPVDEPAASTYFAGSHEEDQNNVSSSGISGMDRATVLRPPKPSKLPLAKALRNYLCAIANLIMLCLWMWMIIDLAESLNIGGIHSAKMYAAITAEHMSSFNGSFNVLSFTGLADSGHFANLASTGGDWYTADTSLGHYYVVVDETLEGMKRYLAIGGQACTAEDAARLVGMISTRCIEGEKECNEYCLILEPLQPVWENVVEVGSNTYLLPRFEIKEYYRLKNSVGFGVMYISQQITSIDVIDGKLMLHTIAIGKGEYEGQWWQWPLIVIVFMALAINALVRFFSLKDIAQGIPLNKSRLTVVADLGGGMITSPGVQASSFIALVVMGLHALVWQDGVHLFEQSFIVQIQISATIAVAAASLFGALCSGTNIKLFNSGTTIFAVSDIIREFTRDESRISASENFNSLGMILGRSCFAWTHGFPDKAQATEFQCNHSDGIGMSGLELFVKVYFVHFTYTVATVAIIEIVFFTSAFLFHYFEIEIPRKFRIHSTSTRTGSLRSGQTRKGQSNANTSAYESSVSLSGARSSVFCRCWSRPVDTPFGRFYTVSSTIEDNQVMWGPLLVTLYMFPLALLLQLFLGKKRAVLQVIRLQLYTGVLEDQFNLVPRRSNGSIVSKFVMNYDYANCSMFINPQPVS